MRGRRIGAVWLAVAVSVARCAPAPAVPPVQPGITRSAPFKAVLVAGDGSLPVFDNATAAMAGRLVAAGAIEPGGSTRLSAAAEVMGLDGVRSASLDHVLDAVAGMQPRQGQGCLVFATSHGAPRRGLYLGATNEFLTPGALDRALTRGCGDAPTVVIVSACYSGAFAAPPMARRNRIVLTAARADRASFGCTAGRTYTVYDDALLDALGSGGSWKAVSAVVRAQVAAEEGREGFEPSQPQAWFGPEVAGMLVPASGVRVGSR